jgi:hypothetical protein
MRSMKPRDEPAGMFGPDDVNARPLPLAAMLFVGWKMMRVVTEPQHIHFTTVCAGLYTAQLLALHSTGMDTQWRCYA